MAATLHALWSTSWWILGTMLTPVSRIANANGETTPQVLRFCASLGSCHENQHSNENRKYASDFDRFWWRTPQKSTWFDKECRQAAIEKNDEFVTVIVWDNFKYLHKYSSFLNVVLIHKNKSEVECVLFTFESNKKNWFRGKRCNCSK